MPTFPSQASLAIKTRYITSFNQGQSAYSKQTTTLVQVMVYIAPVFVAFSGIVGKHRFYLIEFTKHSQFWNLNHKHLRTHANGLTVMDTSEKSLA